MELVTDVFNTLVIAAFGTLVAAVALVVGFLLYAFLRD